MTRSTVDGWAVLIPGSPALHTWTLPDTHRRITLRHGSAGFVLAHLALRFHDLIERLDPPGEHTPDDGGYNYRPMTGKSSPSKHATGCAEDLNWRQHPYGQAPGLSFSQDQIRRIRRWLHNAYSLPSGPVLEWGGDWPSHPGSTAHPDGMHFQIHHAAGIEECEHLARRLMDTPRGQALLDANPGQPKVILS